MNKKELIRRLNAVADAHHAEFSAKIVNGRKRIIGVKTPPVRALAKEILASGQWKEIVDDVDADDSYEVTVIRGLVIAKAKTDFRARAAMVAGFVPQIDSWAICDVFCGEMKIVKKDPEFWWKFIQPYLKSKKDFYIRFAVIMMMCYFLTDDYITEVLNLLQSVHHDGYYVKMGVAWAFSFAFIKYQKKSMPLLKNNVFDDDTHRMAIQKIVDSFRVDTSVKAAVKALRRK